MFFTLSKIGWLVIQPLGLVLFSFLAVLVFSFAKRPVGARVAALIGISIVLAGGQTNSGRLFLQALENRHARPANTPAPADVAGIIVLGGGFDGHVTRVRGGFELGESGDRFVEALRLARTFPGVPVIVSGGEASLIGTTEGDAPIAQRFFSAFGLSPGRLILESKSRNTYENAVLTKDLLPPKATGSWLLVTSAFHMPRSMGAFRQQDIAVMPWPVDYRTSGTEMFEIGRDDPIQAFAELNLAMREWIGLLAYSWTGRIAMKLPAIDRFPCGMRKPPLALFQQW